MANVGKSASFRGNFHLKSLPQEYTIVPSKQKKAQLKNIWVGRTGKEGVKKQSKSLKNKGFKVSGLEFEKSPISMIGLNILFPENILGKLLFVQRMPETKLEEKLSKELAFRNLISMDFEMKQVLSDCNNGLRAIICGLTPELDSRSEEITAIILRGDLVDYVLKHPDSLPSGSDPDILKGYYLEMANSDAPITLKEMGIMSDILETPIHVYRYEDARIGSDHKIFPGKDSLYGIRYQGKKPIRLYYDSIRAQFMPLQLKIPKKFGVLS
jgi:hypothetical protein